MLSAVDLSKLNIHQRLIEVSKLVPQLEQNASIEIGRSKIPVTTYDFVISSLRSHLNDYQIICYCENIESHRPEVEQMEKTAKGGKSYQQTIYRYSAVFRFILACADSPESFISIAVPVTVESFNSMAAGNAETQANRRVWQKVLRIMTGEYEEEDAMAQEIAQEKQRVDEIIKEIKDCTTIPELVAIHDGLEGEFGDQAKARILPFLTLQKNKIKASEKSEPEPEPEPDSKNKGKNDKLPENDTKSRRKRRKSKEEKSLFEFDDTQFDGDVAEQIFEFLLEKEEITRQDAIDCFKVMQVEIPISCKFNEIPDEKILITCFEIIKRVLGENDLRDCPTLFSEIKFLIKENNWDIQELNRDIKQKLGFVLEDAKVADYDSIVDIVDPE